MKYILILVFISLSFSQTQKDECILENSANVLFGVGQVTLGGFNFEVDVAYDRFIFDFSHGMNLGFANKTLEQGADKRQGLAIEIPWTTGFGIGYRFTEWLNLRVEPKWHRFEIYHDGDELNSKNRINNYTTFTLGLGLYTDWRPFKDSNSALSGLMIAPNIRWWPNVSTSLKNDKFTYLNKFSNQSETHKARNIGMANSAFFFNVSVGYAFGI